MKPAEAFPLGEHLRPEMAERGYDDARVLRLCPGLTPERWNEITAGTGTAVALHEAEALASAFGVGPALILNLDRSYRQRDG